MRKPARFILEHMLVILPASIATVNTLEILLKYSWNTLEVLFNSDTVSTLRYEIILRIYLAINWPNG